MNDRHDCAAEKRRVPCSAECRLSLLVYCKGRKEPDRNHSGFVEVAKGQSCNIIVRVE